MLSAVELTLDCADAPALAEFWKLAAGYVHHPPPVPYVTVEEWQARQQQDKSPGGAWLYDPRGVAPSLCLLQVPEPKTAKNRLHLDLGGLR